MKKIWILLLLALLLLSGCGAQETFEIVSDVYDVPASAMGYTLQLQLPQEAVLETMESEAGALYLCDGYTLTVQALEGGDLDRTLQAVTGFEKDALTLMQTKQGDFKRYECAWSAAGEGTQQVCRTLILDDGNTHHAVTVMADYQMAGDLTAQWQHLLSSAQLVSTG